ncbi:plasmid pRiA4b ORF-3 family protein [Arthrobacter sp. FW306-07-I]|uniref:plasmid pRiA4b ORF-3 family protein n=1 Tax=Arthrobacter sp. FW306-07-I TaxID=2879622 RepID=UPI001F24DA88|nr:plasmid pRiA4b ORF-3 family protein [Arthrobacter sp. FW306-07-I]UKA77606.1 plasmid pRiA4b ORF-3 family protein [Arthrobacter sp. FW306-07-I]
MGLVDSHPEIWRQLEIRSTMTLDQVHRVLQAAFGWKDMHLHRFTALEPFVRLQPPSGETRRPAAAPEAGALRSGGQTRGASLPGAAVRAGPRGGVLRIRLR